MKKIIILSLLITLITFVSIFYSSCSVRRAEALIQREFIPENERVRNGERVFMANCQKCHPGGEGGLGPSVNGNIAPQLIKRFQMRHGIGVMPSFKKDEISRKDLRDISKYLRAWKSY